MKGDTQLATTTSSMYGLFLSTAKGDTMNQVEWYEYDEEGDVLDVYFVSERQPAWTIELTPNIMISINRAAQQAVGLTFMDYTALVEPTLWGRRSFPIIGLADLPLSERNLVFAILNSAPVEKWLDVSIVENLPDSPFSVAHLEAPPPELLQALPLEAA